MRKSKNLDLNSRYTFPAELRTVRFDGRIIVVAPLNVTWVVLQNDEQLRFLTRLSYVENLTPCKDCELRYFCGGDCRIKYFDAFKEMDDLRNLPDPADLRRDCPQSVKEHFYRLMLDTNERLFS